MTEIKPIEPQVAVNIINCLVNDREEGPLIFLLRGYCGIYKLPQFEQISRREPDRYSYGHKPLVTVEDETAIGEFFVQLGLGIKAWAETEGPAREKAHAKEIEKRKKAKEKEKEKKKKEREKRAQKASDTDPNGHSDEDDDDSEEGDENFFDDEEGGEE